MTWRRMKLSELRQPPKGADTRNHLSEARSRMQAVDRRDWWVWASASLVMLLLVGATFFLLRAGETATADLFFWFERERAVHGLLGMILLFIVYSFYQQTRFKTLRRELSSKIERLLSAEIRAEEFQKLSMLDYLTGLYNRRFVEKHLETDIAHAQRLRQPLTLMAMDLDDFKKINDTFGHGTGDEVLKCFAKRLKMSIRGSDIPARMGGDEFLVLLPECTPAQAELLCSRLRDLKVEHGGSVIAVSVSTGCAGYVPDDSPKESARELLERADQALYANKRAAKAVR